jgi:UDP-GlcNAc:undecaprenyl-phosphate GlcNAc-1-phosphate transferase
MLSIAFSFLINGLLLKFSRTLGNRDVQHKHNIRWAPTVKPSVGGFSFYILFLIAISLHALYSFQGDPSDNKFLFGIIAAVNAGFILGLADDAYNTIPLLKLSGQLLCGILLVGTNTIIPLTGMQSLDIAVTLIWVVGIMNSINMLDNMDGISGLVSLAILIACILVLYLGSNLYSFNTILLLGVSGALIGFLYYNWHPSKIFMGDTGSQFLGSFIAAISIPVLWNFHDAEAGAIQIKQILIPLIAFSVPIIDTATVFIRRIARGKSPFVGGKDHISHHFVYAGLTDSQVMYLLGGWSFLSAIITALLVHWISVMNNFMVICVAIYFILLFLAVQFFYNMGMKKENIRKATADSNKNNLLEEHLRVSE